MWTNFFVSRLHFMNVLWNVSSYFGCNLFLNANYKCLILMFSKFIVFTLKIYIYIFKNRHESWMIVWKETICGCPPPPPKKKWCFLPSKDRDIDKSKIIFHVNFNMLIYLLAWGILYSSFHWTMCVVSLLKMNWKVIDMCVI